VGKRERAKVTVTPPQHRGVGEGRGEGNNDMINITTHMIICVMTLFVLLPTWCRTVGKDEDERMGAGWGHAVSSLCLELNKGEGEGEDEGGR